MVWTAIIVMVGASIFAVLRALSQARQKGADQSADIAHFRRQLVAIEDAGLAGELTPAEVEASRTEIARRLLKVSHLPIEQSDDLSSPGLVQRRRVVTVLVLLFLPVFSLTFYAFSGSPTLVGKPAQLAPQTSLEAQSIERLLQRLEQQLARQPDNVEGWELLARVHAQLGRLDLAADAFTQAVNYGGATIDRLLALGQAQLAAAGGIVTEGTRQTFERAALAAPDDPRVDFFLALAFRQDGRQDEALQKLARAIAKSPPDAPWLPIIREELARQLLAVLGSDAQPSTSLSDILTILRQTLKMVERENAREVFTWRWRLMAHMVIDGAVGLDALVQEGRAALADDRAARAEFDVFVAQLAHRS